MVWSRLRYDRCPLRVRYKGSVLPVDSSALDLDFGTGLISFPWDSSKGSFLITLDFRMLGPVEIGLE